MITKRNIYIRCKNLGISFLRVYFRYLVYVRRNKYILSHPKAIIKGLSNIETKGLLMIGMNFNGFSHNKDITYINCLGKMYAEGNFSIGRGCRIDIGSNAVVKFGENSDINSLTNLIIYNGLSIGNNCTISWNCQFLDTDFHRIEYECEKEEKDNRIVIGNHVWIGCNVSIMKGVHIGNGCVVAANSLVTSSFEEDNLLIAGSPAKVIKRNISWER